MNVSVVDVSANQKKLQVEIPADKVQAEMEQRYRDLAQRVRIKGFRPGKTPRSILKSYYGKSVESELSSQFIQESFPEALREADLKPLVEADVSEANFAENGSFTYVAVVDVCPPFEVQGYEGLKVKRLPVEVSEDEVASELERLREQHAQLQTVETERPAKEGDVLLIDFTPTIDGKVFERGKTSDYMLELGKNALHPEFDAHFIGRSVGDEVSFDLEYPEDAPTPDIAGKRVHFEATIRELKEKSLPELDDDFASQAGKFDSLDALKQSIRERLIKREEERASVEARRQLTDQLMALVQLDLSNRVVEREVDRMIGQLQYQFESQGLKIDTSKFNTPEIRAEYRTQAEANLKRSLILQQIARQEQIELTPEENEEIYQQVARFGRMDIKTVREEYADSPVVEQSRESKIQEKVLAMLEASSVPDESSDEGPSPEQE